MRDFSSGNLRHNTTGGGEWGVHLPLGAGANGPRVGLLSLVWSTYERIRLFHMRMAKQDRRRHSVPAQTQ